MSRYLKNISNSLVAKLIIIVGSILIVTFSAWIYFNIKYQREIFTNNLIRNIDRLSNTIKMGTHYAMMLNSRNDINQIINNIGKQHEIETVRIYNKIGEIKFSNTPSEIDKQTNIKDEACFICHRTDPPLDRLQLSERIRFIDSSKGYRLMGIITPISNARDCSTGDCHFHSPDKTILGALDVVVSLKKTDKIIFLNEKWTIGFSIFIFSITAAIIFIFMMRFVINPTKKMIKGTRLIANGDYHARVDINQSDEMGRLAVAINKMSNAVSEKQAELNKQKDEYQRFFKQVPCLVTVVDRNYRLIQYNEEFANIFEPRINDFCYHAFKGRDEKCENCSVEKTFESGEAHFAAESGIDKYGSNKYWIVRTSPIKNDQGEVVAAMEMCLDITERKRLEEEVKKSEKKYRAIFKNIPNPLFVLDIHTLEILDCNESVNTIYGYIKADIISRSFLDLFPKKERAQYAEKIKSSTTINQVRHLKNDGSFLFVNIRISPSEYSGLKVWLVTTSDITKRLEAEHQLAQASKLATLGEMATGVAHELNQPLSVIKTSSSFLLKKIRQNEPIADSISDTMLTKMDSNVDRATKIINHLRELARKSELSLKKIAVKPVIEKAHEIFNQQLKLREIEVEWHIDGDLPMILADPDRLEQVFINFFINSRDAIEEKWSGREYRPGDKKITIHIKLDDGHVTVKFCDTGQGIPKHFIDRIFEPFFTTKEAGKGTGLGLSISYGIVKECGGDIFVTHNEKGGACFILKFPVKESNDGDICFTG